MSKDITTTIKSSFEDLPCKNEKFDLIISNLYLHNVMEKELHFKKENAGVINAMLRECKSNFTELSEELEKIARDVFHS